MWLIKIASTPELTFDMFSWQLRQILCLITGPVSLVIDNQVNSHFAFIALTIIFCCFLSMALIFIPKIVEIVRHQQNLGNGIEKSHLIIKSKQKYYLFDKQMTKYNLF